MIYLGIDIGEDFIKITKAKLDQRGEIGFENILFQDSPYIPFSFYYDFYQGGIIKKQTAATRREENPAFELSVFLERDDLPVSKIRSSTFINHSGDGEDSIDKEPRRFLEFSPSEIMTDYFLFIKTELLSCDPGDEIFAEISTNLAINEEKKEWLVNCIKTADYKHAEIVPPVFPCLLSALLVPGFKFEEGQCYMTVDVGREISRKTTIRYLRRGYDVIDRETIPVGTIYISNAVKNLFREQVMEETADVTAEDDLKIAEAADEAIRFILDYYDKPNSRVRLIKGVEVFLDQEAFSNVIVRNFLSELNKYIVRWTPLPANLPKPKVIIPVGGGMHIPDVRRFLNDTFRIKIMEVAQPEMALQRGLALYAVMNFSVINLAVFKAFAARDEVDELPADVGISAQNEFLDFNIMHVLVEKGTRLPMPAPVSFQLTVKAADFTNIVFLEGTRLIAGENTIIQKLQVPIKKVAGAEICRLTLDLQIKERYIIHVNARINNDPPHSFVFRRLRLNSQDSLTETGQQQSKKDNLRAELAILIKKIQGKYNSLKNLMMRRRVEPLYLKASDYEIYAKQKCFDVDVLRGKLDELRNFKQP